MKRKDIAKIQQSVVTNKDIIYKINVTFSLNLSQIYISRPSLMTDLRQYILSFTKYK